MQRRLPTAPAAAHPVTARAVIALVVAALVVAACGANTPSGGPAGSGAQGPGASGSPAAAGPGTGTAGPGGPAPSGPASGPGDGSTELITAAYAAGRIDRPTALLYRLQASVGDDRLPAEFQAPSFEDDGAGSIVLAEWNTFSAEQQAAFMPYLVRPTDPGSVFAPASVSVGGGGVRLASTVSTDLASTRLVAASCTNGFMRTEVTDIPLVIWGQCGGDDAAMAARMADVQAIMTEVWEPMTSLMGDPIADGNVANDEFLDSPESGDGLLDVYLVAGSVSAHARQVEVSSGALAVTREAAPVSGPSGAETSSSYIVASAMAAGGLAFRSTIVHEFFHSLQSAHNNRGMIVTNAPGPGAGWVRHWFVEASAVWAEHHFVPAARATEVYPRFETFQSSAESLASTDGSNEYDSWVWPFFMEQEGGEEAISGAWLDLEGVDGFDPVQEALAREVSFTDRFRDFAVRAYNVDLRPGEPIDPMFADLDADFPDDAPAGDRLLADQVLAVGNELSFDTSLPSLWARYTDLAPDGDVKTIEFDWSGLSPADARDVDVLVETERDGWQRRSEPDKVCNAKRVLVVVSNHDPRRETTVTGAWKATGKTDPCNDGNFTVTLTGPKAGAGTHSGRLDTVSCTLWRTGAWMILAGLDTQGDVYRISASSSDGPGGRLAGISVNTRWAMDDPLDWDWGENYALPGSVTITGDRSAEPWRVHIEASWQETDKTRLSVSADVVCNEMHAEQ